MRTVLYLIRKEFIQIFRNKFISRAIFAVPIVQMLVLVPAVTFEIRNIDLCIIDRDLSAESRQITGKLTGSGFFRIMAQTWSEEEARSLLHKGKCDMIITIPQGFGTDLSSGQPVKIHAGVDAINASAAQISWAYLSGVINDYNRSESVNISAVPETAGFPAINVTGRYWFNELLNYKFYMLPGILVILVTAIGFLLAGLNMVREKEIGTIEQINVTPVRKHQFIIAKMVPFLIIGLADLVIGILIGKLTFNIPVEGNILVLFLGATLFLISVLGLALLISTVSSTQQQFMFTAFFFMIVFILMSGIFTPLESMPMWAQRFDLVNPVAYLIRINRMVMLKGSGLADVQREILSLAVIAVVFTSLAVRRYRKTA
jgi:ABC-2 type transport system permease protein